MRDRAAHRVAVFAALVAGVALIGFGLFGFIDDDPSGGGKLVGFIATPWGIAILGMAFILWRRVAGAGCFTIGLVLPAGFIALGAFNDHGSLLLVAPAIVILAAITLPVALSIDRLDRSDKE